MAITTTIGVSGLLSNGYKRPPHMTQVFRTSSRGPMIGGVYRLCFILVRAPRMIENMHV